jgi:methylated-DNA-[protein]-cysteine S-methyltransferase
MSEIIYASLSAPSWLGNVLVAQGPKGIVAVTMGDPEYGFLSYVERLTGIAATPDQDALRPILDRFQAYIDGDLTALELPVDWSLMTPFQRLVLEEIRLVVPGTVSTYGEIAGRVGRPQGARAVGQALRRNPMPMVIPCHRIIGSDGSMTGFGGPAGIDRKRALLRHEGYLLVD